MATVKEDTSPSVKVVGGLMGILGVTIGFVPSYFIANTNMEVLKHEIESIQKQITTNMDDRYRGADADKDHQLIYQRDLNMRESIKANAEQIEKLEQLVRDHASNRKAHE